MSIFLIIKGSAEDVLKAVEARKIPATLKEGPSLSANSVGMECPNDKEKAIVAWFNEPIKLIMGEGFPVGSLLFYRFLKENDS